MKAKKEEEIVKVERENEAVADGGGKPRASGGGTNGMFGLSLLGQVPPVLQDKNEEQLTLTSLTGGNTQANTTRSLLLLKKPEDSDEEGGQANAAEQEEDFRFPNDVPPADRPMIQ